MNMTSPSCMSSHRNYVAVLAVLGATIAVAAFLLGRLSAYVPPVPLYLQPAASATVSSIDKIAQVQDVNLSESDGWVRAESSAFHLKQQSWVF